MISRAHFAELERARPPVSSPNEAVASNMSAGGSGDSDGGSARPSSSSSDHSDPAGSPNGVAERPQTPPAARRPIRNQRQRIGVPAPKCRRPIRVARLCDAASMRHSNAILAGPQISSNSEKAVGAGAEPASTSKRQRTSISAPSSAFSSTAHCQGAPATSRLDVLLTGMCQEFLQTP